jgi:hypothetical protein
MSKAPRAGLGLPVARHGDFGDWLAVPASLALVASPSTLSQRPGQDTAAQKHCSRVSEHAMVTPLASLKQCRNKAASLPVERSKQLVAVDAHSQDVTHQTLA